MDLKIIVDCKMYRNEVQISMQIESGYELRHRLKRNTDLNKTDMDCNTYCQLIIIEFRTGLKRGPF